MKDILEALKLWIICKLEVCADINPLENEIHYLRMELVKKDDFIKELVGYIYEGNHSKIEAEENIDTTQFEPLRLGKKIPWHVKQRQLEIEDRKKALNLNKEAEIATKKSTEELEEEVQLNEG